jgi:hypothetical protein
MLSNRLPRVVIVAELEGWVPVVAVELVGERSPVSLPGVGGAGGFFSKLVLCCTMAVDSSFVSRDYEQTHPFGRR